MTGHRATLLRGSKDRWPKVQLASAVTAGTNEIAIAMRNMLMTTDKAKQKQELEKVMEARKLIAEKMDRLKEVTNDPRGKEILQKIQEDAASILCLIDVRLQHPIPCDARLQHPVPCGH